MVSKKNHMPQTNLKKARERAKKLGVTIAPSKVKNKKLAVLKNGEIVAHIGDIRYSDFLQHGDAERRRRYKIRHESNRHRRGSAGFYADKILW